MSDKFNNGSGPQVSADEPSVGFDGFTSDGEAPGAESFDFDPSGSFDDAPEEQELQEDDQDSQELEAVQEEVFEGQVEATPRAQKRIQKLAAQKNELASKNDELNALVEQLKKSNELQAQIQQRQNDYLGQQEEVNKAQQRRQVMQQYGLNPEDSRDAIAFEQMEYKAQMENQMWQLQNQIQEQQNAVQVERFNMALDQTLNTKLNGYKVDADVLANIRETAYDIASLNGLTAGEAADAAVSRYKRVLPRTSRPQAGSPGAAARAVTMGNQSKGKAPAQNAGEGTDFLSLIDGGNFRF